MALTWPPDLTDAKDALNLTSSSNDGELQTMLDAAVAVLENHPAYTVADHVKTTEYTEWHDGGQSIVILKHYPISSVTSVGEWSGATSQVIAAEPEGSVSFSSYGYRYDTESGMLYRTSDGYSTSWAGRVKVVYEAGADGAPADIVMACLLLVEHFWETQRGGMGTGSPIGLDADPAAEIRATYALPNRVMELLQPYRKAPAVA